MNEYITQMQKLLKTAKLESFGGAENGRPKVGRRENGRSNINQKPQHEIGRPQNG